MESYVGRHHSVHLPPLGSPVVHGLRQAEEWSTTNIVYSTATRQLHAMAAKSMSKRLAP